jgi:sugar lactone lactonase YvrE
MRYIVSSLSGLLVFGALALPVHQAPLASAATTSWSGKTVDTINASKLGLTGKGKGTFATLGHVTDTTSKGGFKCAPCPAPVQTEFGTLTMKTTSGDKVVFKLTGTQTDTTSNHSGTRYRLSYTWKITHGTGQYTGISGHGTITGYAVVNQTTAIGVEHRTWKGTVKWPQSPAPTATPTSGPAPYHPIGIAVDGQGNIFVQHNEAVTEYGPDGTLLATTEHFLKSGQKCGPWGLALSPQGTVYVADECGPTITVLSPSLQQTGTLTGDSGEIFDNPVVDRQGNIDVASFTGTTVDQFSAGSGKHTILYTATQADTPDRDLWAAAIDPEGNLQVTSIMHGIIKISPTGQFLARSGPIPNFPEIDDIAIDSKGYVYLTAGQGCQCRDEVIKLSPTWQVLGVVAPQGNGTGQVDTPLGLAVDTHDNLYVSDTYNGRIQKFSPSGQFLLSFTGAS